MIDADAQRLAPQTGGGRFADGARVFHRKFGYGVVKAVEGDKLDIAFEKAGSKMVMASFVVAAAEAG